MNEERAQQLREWLASDPRNAPRGWRSELRHNVAWLLAELHYAEKHEQETAAVLHDLLEERGLDKLLAAAREEGRRQGAEEMREALAEEVLAFGRHQAWDRTSRELAAELRALPLPGDAPAIPPAAARR